MSFAGIIGHQSIKTLLSRMLENGRMPHAFLFLGAEGAGKTTFAHALARLLLNHKGDLYAHPDYLTLERLVDEKTGKRKRLIRVDQVRELNVRLGMSSLSGGWKVVWIEEADKLSAGAVNALLKTLEEPKGNVLFLLRSTQADLLPATVVSRAQVLRFGNVAQEEMRTRLVKLGFSPVDAQQAVAQSLGRPGRALRFLKDSAYKSQMETGLAQVLTSFSSSLPERLAQVTDQIPKSEVQKDAMLDSILDAWELVSRELLLQKLGVQQWRVLPNHTQVAQIAQTLSEHTLLDVFARVRHVRTASRGNINAHLALEHIALAF